MLVLSIVFNALAPLIAHAMGGEIAQRMVEICTAQGIKRVALDSALTASDGGDSELPATHETGKPHCMFCPGAGDHFTVLPVVPGALLALPAPASGQLWVSSTTHPLGAPSSVALARAPPLV